MEIEPGDEAVTGQSKWKRKLSKLDRHGYGSNFGVLEPHDVLIFFATVDGHN